jgi:hypothetical protein
MAPSCVFVRFRGRYVAILGHQGNPQGTAVNPLRPAGDSPKPALSLQQNAPNKQATTTQVRRLGNLPEPAWLMSAVARPPHRAGSYGL